MAQAKIGSTADLPVFTGENGIFSTKTAAEARNALGLGNTAGALPIANGGTGATSAADALAAIGAAPSGFISATYNCATENEITTAINTALANIGNNKATMFVINIAASGLSLNKGTHHCTLNRASNLFATVTAIQYTATAPSIQGCSLWNGTWSSWYDYPDVESGTWTPEYVSGSYTGGFTVATTGTYCKVGKLVHVSIVLQLSDTIAAGVGKYMCCTGLPKPASHETYSGTTFFANCGSANNFTMGNDSYMIMYFNNTGSSAVNPVLRISGVYESV